jgi:catechol 2,3-dioxygenase-like lactoylglutathione lyase family enzyme
VLAIWHVAFPVSDLDRSVAFYCGALGFDLVGRDEETAFVSLGPGGFTLELMACPDGRGAGGAGAPDHIAFDTPDLDAYRGKLIAAGLAVPDVQVIAEGMKRFAVSDPDGLRLDVFQGRAGFEAFISRERQ